LAQEPKAILDTTSAASGAAPAEGEATARRRKRRAGRKAAIPVGLSSTGRKATRRGEMVGEGAFRFPRRPIPVRAGAPGKAGVCGVLERSGWLADRRKNTFFSFQPFIFNFIKCSGIVLFTRFLRTIPPS
jgi:hypothetical protein